MGKQKTAQANAPTTNKSGDKFGTLSVPAKAGTFNSASVNTEGGKKKK